MVIVGFGAFIDAVIRCSIISIMNSQKCILATSALLLLITAPVSAASPTPSLAPFGNRDSQLKLDNTYHPPKLYVADAKITTQTPETVTGTFTLQNQEDYIINGQYRLELMGAVPAPTREKYGLSKDTTILYSRQAALAAPALIPKENRPITFTYTWPNVPAG